MGMRVADFGDAGEFVAAGRGFGGARGAAHVVVMEVCQVAVVERGRGVVGEHVADVAGDPFARGAGGVGLGGRTARREVAAVAGVEQHAGAVGEDEQGGVAAAGVDLVDVEGSGGPGRQGLAGLLGEGGDGEKEGKRIACVDSVSRAIPLCSTPRAAFAVNWQDGRQPRVRHYQRCRASAAASPRGAGCHNRDGD